MTQAMTRAQPLLPVDHALREALAHVMCVGQMAFQNGYETTEGCGLVSWAGRLSQQVSQFAK